VSNEKNKRTHLTPTGLLMEGDYTQNPQGRIASFSAQTLPIGPKKDATGRHKTVRTRADKFRRQLSQSRAGLGL